MAGYTKPITGTHRVHQKMMPLRPATQWERDHWWAWIVVATTTASPRKWGLDHSDTPVNMR
jgi:hypothetical protein